jgi:membrane-associated phospholipid phosphatase
MLFIAVCLDAEPPGFAREYLLSYPGTAIHAAKQPLRWESSEWQKAGMVLFTAGALYLFDEEIHDLIQANRSSFTHDLATAGNQFGEGLYVLPALGVTWLGGYAFGSPKTKDTALLCLKSFLLANGASVSIKYLTQRERPFEDEGKGFWNGKGFNKTRDSFPSGHATIVWSIAPILAEQYKESKWVPPAAYGVAVLTSYARMHNERHWASDVFAGAMVGYLTSQLVLKTTPRLQVIPSVQNPGISVFCSF